MSDNNLLSAANLPSAMPAPNDAGTVPVYVSTTTHHRRHRAHGTWSRSAALAALLTTVLIAGGCIAQQQAVPDFLIHNPTPVIRDSDTNQSVLIRELYRAQLPKTADYIPAEQIATHAYHELKQGNEWDAAVLLSFASYRYHQQAYRISEIGEDQLQLINPSAKEQYTDWVIDEIKLFNTQNFDAEQALLRSHLFGDTAASERYDKYLTSLAQGGREDEGLSESLQNDRVAASNRKERLAYPRLATALRERLERDHKKDSTNNFAFYYLATTPLDQFRLAALDVSKTAMYGHLIGNIVPRIESLRRQIRDRLQSPYGVNTRSLAAVILGLAGNEEDRALLEKRLAEESDQTVKDSIRLALIWHGQDQHLADLIENLKRGRLQQRVHLLRLLQWLPRKAKLTLDDELLASQVRRHAGVNANAQIMALYTLKNIASEKTITANSIETLLRYTSDSHEQVAQAAAGAVAAASQLGAHECQVLYRTHTSPQARAALVSRLGANVSLSDLPFLVQAYQENTDFRVKLAVILAVANIPAAASLDLLKQWLRDATTAEDIGPFMTTVAALATRSDFVPSALDDVDLSDMQRLMVSIAHGSDDMRQRADAVMSGFRTSRFGTSTKRNVKLPQALQLTALSLIFPRAALVTTLRKLSRYSSNEAYPRDTVVRRNALGALIRVAIKERSVQDQAGAVSRVSQN